MEVNKVDLASGETLLDLTSDTVTPQTLAEGETAHNAQGERIVGIMPTSGGSTEKEIELVTCNLDIATMSVLDFSHTYEQLDEAIANNKSIILRVEIPTGPVFASFSLKDIFDKVMVFSLLYYGNVGAGFEMYYFRVVVSQNNTIVVEPHIISLLD